MSASIKELLAQNSGRIRLLEAHDSNSREVIRNSVGKDGQHFHGIWISGLTQTTYLGVPDTELISPLKRASLIPFDNTSAEHSSRPLCAAYDADSGGDVADIPALVSLLASRGVSMIIIEDKAVLEPGKKVNSLAGTSSLQAQADKHEFAETIRAFKAASAGTDMIITSRIETFTVRIAKADEAEEKASVQAALDDALERAKVYKSAGTDAIMIHSKSSLPDEVSSFLTEYRATDPDTPLVVVPTTYCQTTEDALHDAGANVIIYANHLMRAKISAVSEFSDKFLAQHPNFFAQDPELRAALEARNFGYLVQKLAERRKMYEVLEQYRVIAENYALENMSAVVKALLDGQKAGAADTGIISVKELLMINSRQISRIEALAV